MRSILLFLCLATFLATSASAQVSITGLSELSGTPADGDLIPIVDVSDTAMSANGTTKKITIQNFISKAGGITWTTFNDASPDPLALNTGYAGVVDQPVVTIPAMPGGPSAGDQVQFRFDVQGANRDIDFHTNSSVYRVDGGLLSAAINLEIGPHWLNLQYVNSRWELTDSGVDEELANLFYASPDSVTGAPDFRAMVAGDIPDDIITAAKFADGDWGDVSVATNSVTLDAGTVDADALASTTVTPGSYTFTDITVDADGRITAASNGSPTEVTWNAFNDASPAALSLNNGYAGICDLVATEVVIPAMPGSPSTGDVVLFRFDVQTEAQEINFHTNNSGTIFRVGYDGALASSISLSLGHHWMNLEYVNSRWELADSGFPAGTSGQVLTSNGAGAAPTFQTPTGGGDVATDAIFDAAGDLVVGTGADASARLAIGAAYQKLRVNSGATNLEYFTEAGLRGLGFRENQYTWGEAGTGNASSSTSSGIYYQTATGSLVDVDPTSTSTRYSLVTTGAVTGNRVIIDSGSSDKFIWSDRAYYYKVVVNVVDTTDVRLWVGVANVNGTTIAQSDDPAAEYAGFRFSTGVDSFWMCVTDDGTQSAVASDIALAAGQFIFEIIYNGTDTKFYIDNVLKRTATVNQPSVVAMAPFFTIETKAEAAKQFGWSTTYYESANP